MKSRTYVCAAGVIAALALSVRQAGAQGFPTEKAEQARAAVQACTAADGRKDEAAARPAIQQATALLRDWIQAESRGVEPRMGNVRELRNAVERAAVMAEGEVIEAGDLPPQLAESRAPLGPVDAALADLPFAEARDRAMDEWERRFLAAALERHGGNVSATARALERTARACRSGCARWTLRARRLAKGRAPRSGSSSRLRLRAAG